MEKVNKQRALEIAKSIGMNLNEQIIITLYGGTHQHTRGGRIHHDGWLVTKTGPHSYKITKVHSDD